MKKSEKEQFFSFLNNICKTAHKNNGLGAKGILFTNKNKNERKKRSGKPNKRNS